MTAEVHYPFQNVNDWKYYDKETTSCTQQDVATTLKRGQLLIDAKAQLSKADFRTFVSRHYSMSTAKRLMIITKHPIIGNLGGAHVNHPNLPHSWGTLYELTKLDNDTLTAALKDETINSKTERKDIAQMLAQSAEKARLSPPTGLDARIIDTVKAAKKGMIPDEIAAAISDVKERTVFAATSVLKKAGKLASRGERRKGRSGHTGAILYVSTRPPKKEKPLTAKDTITAAKELLVTALKGTTNYERAKVLIGIAHAVKADFDLMYQINERELIKQGKITSLRIMGTPKNVFVPEGDDK
jgi:hypothetical protein